MTELIIALFVVLSSATVPNVVHPGDTISFQLAGTRTEPGEIWVLLHEDAVDPALRVQGAQAPAQNCVTSETSYGCIVYADHGQTVTMTVSLLVTACLSDTIWLRPDAGRAYVYPDDGALNPRDYIPHMDIPIACVDDKPYKAYVPLMLQ